MSFWENNKDTFKSAGKSVVSGTKAVGKAGVRTYKKNEAKRNGTTYDDPYPQESKSGETYTPYQPTPLPSKEQLSSFAPPPKRNVPTYGVPQKGEASKYAKPAAAAAPAPQAAQPQAQQPVQYDQQYQQQEQPPPPSYSLEAQSQVQPQPQTPVYNQSVQDIQQQPLPPTPQSQGQQVLPPSQVQLPQRGAPPVLPQRGAPPPSLPSRNSAGSVSTQSSGYSQPAAQPAVFGQPAPQPGTQPAAYGQPAAQPATYGQPAAQPAVYGQPAAEPTYAQPAVQPAAYGQPAAQPAAQPATYTPPAAQPAAYGRAAAQPTAQPAEEPVKPKSVLPDPTSFIPPPRRVDLPPLKNRQGSQGSVPSVASSASSSQPAATYGAPVTPTRTNDNDTSSVTGKKKPPKPKKLQVEQPVQSVPPAQASRGQQFNLNAFPNPRQVAQEEDEEYTNPPKPARPVEEEEYTNPPKPPRPQDTDPAPPPMPARRSTNEGIPPPMPARRATNEGMPPPMPARRNTNDQTPPPMPSRSQADAAAISHKKAPPPKPLKKPSTLDGPPPAYSNHATAAPQGDVSNELNNIFQRMNISKGAQSSGDTPEAAAPKPKPKPKPEIAAKPAIGQPDKPKPPVPKHRETTPQKSPTPPPAPPSRNYSRAAAPVPPRTTPEQAPVQPKPSGPPQLDLELHTGWYAKRDGPLQLPKDLEGSNYKTMFSTGSGFGGKQNFTITARLKDLSIITYKFEYSNNNINDVNVVIENYIPSPLERIPTKQELVANHERFGEYVAGWCEHHKGKTVGRGECWDLAKEALQKGCGNHAFVSTYVIHGYPILQVANSGSGLHFINSNSQLDEIRRGDILQFNTCTFFDAATGVTSTCGQPDHTAIVVRKEGERLFLLEQNSGGRRYVVDGECVIKNLTQGQMCVFRPMPKEWAGEL